MLPILYKQPSQQPECQRNLLLCFARHGDEQNRTGRNQRDNSDHHNRYREWHSIRQSSTAKSAVNRTAEQKRSIRPAGTTETAGIAARIACTEREKNWNG